MSEIGSLKAWRSVRGLSRYEIEVSHRQLHKFQVVRGDDFNVVEQKARALAAQWDEMWRKRTAVDKSRKDRETAARDIEGKRRLAVERTEEARRAIRELENTLAHTLAVNDTINWDALKDTAEYPVPKPTPPTPPPPPKTPAPPREPQPSDPKFQYKFGFLDLFIPSHRAAKVSAAEAAFAAAQDGWVKASAEQAQRHKTSLEEHKAALRSQLESHRTAMARWEEGRQQFLRDQEARNAAVELKKERYHNSDPEAVSDYCDMVLANSSYPDWFPQSYQLEYNPDNRILVVDYQLPSPAGVPSTIEVRYVQSTDQFAEKQMSTGQRNQLYDSLLYQIALRTIHELYEADRIGAIASVVFNGYVRSIDSSTGQETNACVLSLLASSNEFLALNLASVEPRACFKKLKGVGSARLHGLAAVAPLLTISREDKRFVAAQAVAATLVEEDNLAAMDWQDFEHLIRELFEMEFSAVGGEVKVTRASRDHGVDAVIFDPDPLRGGKTVIQAKRYVNTVDVAAVRDLYGTVLNEGANKGILVTTSDYGPDAYEFAKGKPLVLLNGSNLLHLLERHGHKAKIDLQEAKKLLTDRGIL